MSVMTQEKITIKKERAEKILLNRHPWIFSGAVSHVPQGTDAGDIVQVADASGNIFAQAAYNPHSDIRLRIIKWEEKGIIDDGWFLKHIKNLSLKKEHLLGITEMPENKKNYRVVFSDADSIPGLIIDRYGLIFVIQLQTLFADKNRDLWVSIIKQLWNPSGVYEKSDVPVRKKEGLSDLPSGILSGEIPEKFIIEEDNFKIIVDVINGQKTGYFLDLRQIRKRVEYWCRIFNFEYIQNYFGYTGSFNLYAVRAGVKKIEHIDISQSANDIAKENSRINGFEKQIQVITANSFEFLMNTHEESVGAIILDPPSFVKTKAKISSAVSGYERLNTLAMKKLAKGGLLFSLCCSSYIDEETFRKILFKSSSRAHCDIKVIEKLGQDVDHSWSLNFPEGRYLQGWVLHKV